MMLLNQEVSTIEEAFALLTPEQQEHAKRVSAYAEAAFAKITAMDLYIGLPHSERELVKDNVRWVALGALYHDIGKLLPDETDERVYVIGEDGADAETPVPKEHTQHGAEIVSELYPDFRKLKGTERKLILDGIRDHHERMDGSGGPFGKVQRENSYAGRVVALADVLDHRAMTLRSEDPIADVLDGMRQEVREGKLDPEFYRAFRSCRAKLKKIFEANSAGAAAVPAAEPWIRRKASRPLELKYRRGTADGADIWRAEMFFKNTAENDHRYADVRHIVSAKKLGVKMGDYFLYELCDTLRRFDACGVLPDRAALMLPETWYSQKKLAQHIQEILTDEEIPPERILLLLPKELTEKPGKTLSENLAACAEAGLHLIPEADTYIVYPETAETPAPETPKPETADAEAPAPEAPDKEASKAENAAWLTEESIVQTALHESGVTA